MVKGDWQSEADRLAKDSMSRGDATGWFERLWSKGRDGEVSMPWDSGQAHPLLVGWAHDREPAAAGQRAVVVGCGLGADAELIAATGFETIGFDVSQTAIDLARARHGGSPVHYQQADLFSPPGEWHHAFDLVVDVYTTQALPVSLRPQVTAAVAGLLAPAGTLVLVMAAQDPDGTEEQGPPWPLSRRDIEAFGQEGLTPARIELLPSPVSPTAVSWRAEYHRPPDT